MPSLIETNPHLRDPDERRRLIEADALESSVFEGATGLPRPVRQTSPRVRALDAEVKKEVRTP